MIDGEEHPCRAVSKPTGITPGILLKKEIASEVSMEVQFPTQVNPLPFGTTFITNNNPTDTGLVHWVCYNTLQKFADPAKHWGLMESFYHGSSSPMVDYMNNLVDAIMLENKSYGELTYFAKLELGSVDYQKEYRRPGASAVQLPHSDPLAVARGSVQAPYEHTVVKSYNFRDTWKLTQRTVTVRFVTNNDPEATGLIDWIFTNMFTRMPITKVSESLPSTSTLTKASYISNTPTLDILNKLGFTQRRNTGNCDNWTCFKSLEVDAEESDMDYLKRKREREAEKQQ